MFRWTGRRAVGIVQPIRGSLPSVRVVPRGIITGRSSAKLGGFLVSSSRRTSPLRARLNHTVTSDVFTTPLGVADTYTKWLRTRHTWGFWPGSPIRFPRVWVLLFLSGHYLTYYWDRQQMNTAVRWLQGMTTLPGSNPPAVDLSSSLSDLLEFDGSASAIKQAWTDAQVQRAVAFRHICCFALAFVIAIPWTHVRTARSFTRFVKEIEAHHGALEPLLKSGGRAVVQKQQKFRAVGAVAIMSMATAWADHSSGGPFGTALALSHVLRNFKDDFFRAYMYDMPEPRSLTQEELNEWAAKFNAFLQETTKIVMHEHFVVETLRLCIMAIALLTQPFAIVPHAVGQLVGPRVHQRAGGGTVDRYTPEARKALRLMGVDQGMMPSRVGLEITLPEALGGRRIRIHFSYPVEKLDQKSESEQRSRQGKDGDST